MVAVPRRLKMEKEIQLWCRKNGWTDLYYVKEEDLFYGEHPNLAIR
jgi:hypothetical protein